MTDDIIVKSVLEEITAAAAAVMQYMVNDEGIKEDADTNIPLLHVMKAKNEFEMVEEYFDATARYSSHSVRADTSANSVLMP